MKKNQKGFTLIELMIVVAIIGILAAVAIPKFAEMMERSRDGATKGNIGALKSAVSIYYGDHEGTYPSDLTATFVQASSPTSWNFIAKYIDNIPAVKSQGGNKLNNAYNNGTNKNPWGGGGQSSGYIFQGSSSFSTGLGNDLSAAPTIANAATGYGYKYESATGLVWVNSTLNDMSALPYTLFGYN